MLKNFACRATVESYTMLVVHALYHRELLVPCSSDRPRASRRYPLRERPDVGVQGSG